MISITRTFYTLVENVARIRLISNKGNKTKSGLILSYSLLQQIASEFCFKAEEHDNTPYQKSQQLTLCGIFLNCFDNVFCNKHNR